MKSLYIALNESPSRDYPYYFDRRVVQAFAAPPRVGVKRLGLMLAVALGLLSLLSLESVLREHTIRAAAGNRGGELYAHWDQRLQEIQHIHALVAAENPPLSVRTRWQIAEAVVHSAETYGVDPYLVLAVIRVESAFNPRAISTADARGLMQILPPVAEELAAQLHIDFQPERTIYEPRKNIMMGTFFLSQLLSRFGGDLEASLLAYNWGPNHIAKAIREGTETPRGYALRVQTQYKRYQSQRERLVRAAAENGALSPAVVASR